MSLINIKTFTTVTKCECATICICFDYCIFCILICDVNTKNKKVQHLLPALVVYIPDDKESQERTPAYVLISLFTLLQLNTF